MQPLLSGGKTPGAAAAWHGLDLIHIETHGFVDMDDPQLSNLQLTAVSPGRKADAAHTLTLRDVYRTPTAARLVVLAACDTGVGQWMPGEGQLSLAHGFLSAGAGSVIASLWRIGDAASDELLAEFYRLYAQNGDHIAALAAAQRHLASNPRWSHPYYWAGVVAHL
jgi:CHAT domain-containing protein